MARPRTIYLIDGSAQFHRAYHAIRGLATSRGLPTNATYGFTTMLRKLVQDEKPEWMGISFDLAGPTFRHEEYQEYKANRPRMHDDLAVQIPYVRRVCDVFRLPIIETAGFEADDVIATLAHQAVAKGWKVVVVSGDKDLLQMVTEDVLVLNPGREGMGAVLYDIKTVTEKFGVPPGRVVDVLGLVGDSVDNIPGVPGIGEKGARDLITEFGSLEAALDNADKVKRAAYREGLKNHRENALLSKHLATLRTDAPVTLDPDLLVHHEPDRAAAHALFLELEFVALAKEYAPEAAVVGTDCCVGATLEELAAAVAELQDCDAIAISVVATSPLPMRAELLGLALAGQRGRAFYVPLGHQALGATNLPREEALEILRPLFADPGVKKLSAHAKRDRVLLSRFGLAFEGLGFDAIVASYLINPGRRAYSVEDLSLEFLNERPVSVEEAVGDAAAPVEAAAKVAGQEADIVLRLVPGVRARLDEEGLSEIFDTMELPLVAVLADMERAGVKIDRPHLAALSRDLDAQIVSLTREIYALAKGEFNINSPIQLRDILFDRLGLKAGRKTAKTRAASTSEDVLEELALTHELPRKILEYRSVQKLKSTYVDALPALVSPETGRIHASFNQTIAATGRISSSDPNLQNIPIRTAEGRRIREAFVAEPGHLLLSADYSQIELRILAHLSKDQTLIDTFRRNEDVHDRTSREVFGELSHIAKDEQRRISKMINYALLYGKSAFTLAKDIGVSRTEAEHFIEAYFARYPSVRRYMEETVEKAREAGAVRTLLGRLRRFPDLRSRNFQIRAEAERQARNMPFQGSAADLIKKAMIELHRIMREGGMGSRLILQIHDELLLEVPESEAEEARGLVKKVMEEALVLEVPLVVDARLGRNWAEAH
jgi:DNA polymerase I